MSFTARYYIGLNDRYTKKQEHSTEWFIGYLDTFIKYFEIDCTITQATGYYKGVKENTIVLELFDNLLTPYKLNELKEVFNQECIAQVIIQSDIEFI